MMPLGRCRPKRGGVDRRCRGGDAGGFGRDDRGGRISGRRRQGVVGGGNSGPGGDVQGVQNRLGGDPERAAGRNRGDGTHEGHLGGGDDRPGGADACADRAAGRGAAPAEPAEAKDAERADRHERGEAPPHATQIVAIFAARRAVAQVAPDKSAASHPAVTGQREVVADRLAGRVARLR